MIKKLLLLISLILLSLPPVNAQEIVPKEYIFYSSDSLQGFDLRSCYRDLGTYNAISHLSKSEKRAYMLLRQNNFISAKYHLNWPEFQDPVPTLDKTVGKSAPERIAKPQWIGDKNPQNTIKNSGSLFGPGGGAIGHRPDQSNKNTQADRNIPNPGVSNAACDNFDFEHFDWTNWNADIIYSNTTSYSGTREFRGFQGFPNASVNACSHHTLVSGGTDPVSNKSMVCPSGGSYSARLGSASVNVGCDNTGVTYGSCSSIYAGPPPGGPPGGPSAGEVIWQNITVTASNALLTYFYNVMLSDGGHGSNEQPYFAAWVIDNTNTIIGCSQYIQVCTNTGTPPPGYGNAGPDPTDATAKMYYSGWQGNSFDLTPYIGTTVQIQFIAAGCTVGGHFGYAYVDGYCGPKQLVVNPSAACVGSSMTVYAPPAPIGSTYSWTGPGVGGAGTSSVTVTANGTYGVTVTAPAPNNTCPYTISTAVAFTPYPVVNPSSSNPACNGAATGTASVSPTGGSGFSYNWSPAPGGGQGTSSVTGLSGGTTYTCTVTNSAGCATNGTVSIVNPAALNSSSAGQVNVLCNGNSTGTASISASGGTGSLTYTWSPAPGGGQGTTTATGLPAGINYTCTVHDANSCATAQVFNLSQPATAISSSQVSQTNVLCNGSATGSAQVSASGGSPGYSYTWTGGTITSGQGTTTASGLAAGTYTCTIHDNNSCASSQVFTLSQPASALSSSQVSQTNILCNGNASGSAQVSASGGSPGYSYTWTGGTITGGQGTTTATGLASGTYTCTIHDNNNCASSQVFTLTQPASALSSSSVSQTNILCNGNSTGTAQVSAGGGAGGYTYTWTGGTITAGQGTTTASGLAAGTYTCTIHDVNSCASSQVFTLSQPASALSISSSSSTLTGCGIATGTATVSVSGGTGADTYTWSPAPGGGQGTNTATGLSATTYTVTVHDANLCPQSTTFTIPTAGGPSVTLSSSANAKCNASCDGTAAVNVSGGTGPYTYSWSGGAGTAATASALCPATYTCTVHDANNCASTQTVTITSPAVLTASSGSQTNASCNGTATGSATVSTSGGTPGYTYTWSGGTIGSGQSTATAGGLANGTYTCTVHDANSCSSSQTFTITQPAVLVLTPSSTQTGCGVATGTASVSAAGGTAGYAYLWNPAPGGGQNTANATALAVGSYTVTVTDSKGCSSTSTYNITSANAPVASLSASANPACNAACTGTATVSASGGTGAYTYSWTSGAGSSASASGLCAGTYSCTITDANNCSVVQTAVIGQPTALALAPSQTNVACNAGSTGSATATVSGGTGSYTYSWSPSGGNAATANALAAGTYTCTVNDANNCSTSKVYTITEPTALSIAPSQVNADCNGNSSGSATVALSGGTSAYTYSWSGGTITGGQGTASATGLASGTYTCTVTDAHNCVASQHFTISQPAALVLTPSSTQTGCGTATGTASVSVAGGTSTYTYFWAPAPGIGQNTANAGGLSNGNYTVTVTDAHNCVQTSVFNISSAGGPSATLSGSTNALCKAACNGTAAVNITGGTGAMTYSWSGGAGNASSASSLCAGTYTCTITDANNCSTTQSVVISEPALLTVAPSQTNVACNAGTGGSATATVSGGTANYSYAWAPSGGNAATAGGLAAGTYTCTVTDANSCSTTQTYTITEPAALVITPSQTNLSCNGNNSGMATALVSGGTSTYTYAWAPSGGSASTATGLAAGTYTCTVTDAHACVTAQTYTLTQPATLNSSGNAVSATCNLNNGTATVTPTGGSGNYSYSWSPSGGNAATASGLAPGNYTCNVKDSLGCTSSATVTIINTGTKPTASVNPSGSTSFCQGASTVLAATGGTSYSWNTGATNDWITVTSAGTYTVHVINSCGTDSAKVQVTENPLPVTVVSGGTSFCKGDSSLLVASGGSSYSWSDGFIGSSHYVHNSGAYTVTATNSCGSTSTSVNVTVNSITAGYIQSADSGYYPLPVVFTDTSKVNPVSWSWTFGDGGTSNSQNPNNTYSSSGTYTVTLTVTNAAGCSSTKTSVITISDTPSWIVIPTVFTPNGDGTNDILLISSAGIVEFHADFFDRWGVLLASLNNVNEAWDGRTVGGQALTNGTYYYVVTAKGDDKRVFNLKGFVELIH